MLKQSIKLVSFLEERKCSINASPFYLNNKSKCPHPRPLFIDQHRRQHSTVPRHRCSNSSLIPSPFLFLASSPSVSWSLEDISPLLQGCRCLLPCSRHRRWSSQPASACSEVRRCLCLLPSPIQNCLYLHLSNSQSSFISLPLSHCHSQLPPLILIPTADFYVQKQSRSVFDLWPPLDCCHLIRLSLSRSVSAPGNRQSVRCPVAENFRCLDSAAAVRGSSSSLAVLPPPMPLDFRDSNDACWTDESMCCIDFSPLAAPNFRNKVNVFLLFFLLSVR